MEKFDQLIDIVETLLSPTGCPWDREQTFLSLRPYLIEEVYELIEAIHLKDASHIAEEIGDLLFHLVFLAKIAEKEKLFHLEEVVALLNEKLKRRHPHVFTDKKECSISEVEEQWEAIKKLEKGKEQRKSFLDAIPKGLPSLAKAQKISQKLSFSCQHPFSVPFFNNEEELGAFLYEVVKQANMQGLNSEQALLKQLMQIEKEFYRQKN